MVLLIINDFQGNDGFNPVDVWNPRLKSGGFSNIHLTFRVLETHPICVNMTLDSQILSWTTQYENTWK